MISPFGLEFVEDLLAHLNFLVLISVPVDLPLAGSASGDSVPADSALVGPVLAVSALESLFAVTNNQRLPDRASHMCEGASCGPALSPDIIAPLNLG